MSNRSLCILILTKWIGFEETTVDNNKKIVLSDEFDVDAIRTFKEYFENFLQTSENNNKSSDEMKMFENKSDNKINDESFWSCNHCTFHNPIYSTTCQMCGIPHRNVCVDLRSNICFLQSI